MTQFNKGTFAQRFAAMGDEAEGVFEEVHRSGFVRYGLNRPPIQMGGLDPFIRYTPDYLTSRVLVEVQGFGADQTIKIKHDKWAALQQWSMLHQVELFLWDTRNKRFGYVPLPHLHHLIEAAETRHFDEGNPYYALPSSVIPCEWVDHPAPVKGT